MRNTFVSKNPRVWGKGNIKIARERIGLTQIDLADKLGVKQQRISEWETGTHSPMPVFQRVLSDFFKFTMPDPWNYTEEKLHDIEVQQGKEGLPHGGDSGDIQGSKPSGGGDGV